MQSHPLADHRGLLWQKVQSESCLNFFTLGLRKYNVSWDKMSEFALLFLETSIRTARVRSRRSASRSSWWSCPISGPHRCTWWRTSVSASGGRNWDVCVLKQITQSHAHHYLGTVVKRMFFSAVLFNMHDTDNDGTITLEEYRHVSLCCSLLWIKMQF